MVKLYLYLLCSFHYLIVFNNGIIYSLGELIFMLIKTKLMVNQVYSIHTSDIATARIGLPHTHPPLLYP